MSGIWIRSQNKEVLLYSGKLQYANNDSKHLIISVENVTKDGTDALVVGEYPTEERAIEVLDEIQSVIAKGTTEAHELDTGRWCKVEKYGVIYQMPQDKDVAEGGEA